MHTVHPVGGLTVPWKWEEIEIKITFSNVHLYVHDATPIFLLILCICQCFALIPNGPLGIKAGVSLGLLHQHCLLAVLHVKLHATVNGLNK